MATTIRDIARAAPVSIGTVSRALKNQPGLSETTRARIVAIAQQMAYDPAQLRPRIKRLTFLLHRQHSNFSTTPFFSHVLHGVEDACRERGIVPTLLTVGPTDDVLRQMRPHVPDAIAVAGFMEPETLDALGSTGCPLVLIDLWAPGHRCVNVDNDRGAALAMERLLDHPGGRPDAVFAYNDVAALAALRICTARGLRVPDDIAIVGFDDIPAATHAAPPLTTLAVDKEALGRRGVELLFNDAPESVDMRLPLRLVARASSQAAALSTLQTT